MDSEIKIGSIVMSTSGRDAATYFVVVEIVSEDRVKLVNGEMRVLSNPKLKNIKHVKNTGHVLEGIAKKIINGNLVFDKEIKKAIRVYLESNK